MTPVERQEQEATLLKKAAQFDEAALTQLHDMYANVVYRYIGFRISSPATVEDLTHEVFARLLEAFKRRSGPQKSVRGWLIGTASNVINDFYRQVYKTEEVEMSDEIASAAELPDQSVEKREREEALHEALEKLTADQQEVLALRYGAGYSIKEVAGMMKKSEGSIKMLQARAIASLGRFLGEGLYGF